LNQDEGGSQSNAVHMVAYLGQAANAYHAHLTASKDNVLA